MRTWAAQQEHELQERKRWLEAVAAQDLTIQEMADRAGIERGSFQRMCRNHGVELLSLKRKKHMAEAKRSAEILKNAAATKAAKKAEQQRQSIIQRTRENAARELQRRKSMLMAEGFTEQQALRALAHQLGVNREAAQ